MQVRVQREGLNNVTDTSEWCLSDVLCSMRVCVYTDVRDYNHLCLYIDSFKVLRSFHKCTIIPTTFYLRDLMLVFPEMFDSLSVSHTQTCAHTPLHTQFQPHSSIQQGRNTGLTL